MCLYKSSLEIVAQNVKKSISPSKSSFISRPCSFRSFFNCFSISLLMRFWALCSSLKKQAISKLETLISHYKQPKPRPSPNSEKVDPIGPSLLSHTAMSTIVTSSRDRRAGCTRTMHAAPIWRHATHNRWVVVLIGNQLDQDRQELQSKLELADCMQLQGPMRTVSSSGCLKRLVLHARLGEHEWIISTGD